MIRRVRKPTKLGPLIGVRLREERDIALRADADTNNTSAADIVRRLIDAYLDGTISLGDPRSDQLNARLDTLTRQVELLSALLPNPPPDMMVNEDAAEPDPPLKSPKKTA